jgi:hypothetical protein
MAVYEERPKETVYAVPEFYVYVYTWNHNAMLSYEKLTPEQAGPLLEKMARDEFVTTIRDQQAAVVRATWQMRDILEGNAAGKAPVWKNTNWWRTAENIWCDHNVMSSTETPGMLAYYQSLEKACLGIRTKIKPGRYLSKYFAGVLSEAERARMAKWQETGSLSVQFDDADKYPLSFAHDADEIANVYETGPHSCMSGDDWDGTNGQHPTIVYAAGDLAIAYLTEEITQKIRARALVWPAKKLFGRVYPTPQNWSTDDFADETEAENMQSALTNRLLNMEYKTGLFCGAKLSKIELDDGGYLMPYLDQGYGVDHCGDHFVMSKDPSIKCDTTDGRVEADDERDPCDRCDDRDDNLYRVYADVSSSGNGRNAQDWCYSCRNNHTFFCNGIDEYVSDDVDQTDVDGSTYSYAYANTNFTRSDYSDEYFDGDSVTISNGDTWSQDEFDAHGFVCAIDGDNYPNTEMHPEHPGVHADHDDDVIAEWLANRIADPNQVELSV